TPPAAVAVSVPPSVAPAVPVPGAIDAVTMVELSVASITPLLRTCTTGCVLKAAGAVPPAGCVATNKVRTGGGVPLPLELPLPPPPPHERRDASSSRQPNRSTEFERIQSSQTGTHPRRPA